MSTAFPSPSAEHPDELRAIGKWRSAIPHYLAPPDWAGFLAFLAGSAAALCASPRGRIATFIDAHRFSQDWPPTWLPWWFLVMAVVTICLLLASLLMRRRSENRLTALKERLARTKNLLIVLNVELVRVTDTRWNIWCPVRAFLPFRDANLPSILFLGTSLDSQKHPLKYNALTDRYEGGADASAFTDAIKQDMQVPSVGNGPCFLRVSVTTEEAGWRIIGATDDENTAWVIAAYNLNVRPRAESLQT